MLRTQLRIPDATLARAAKIAAAARGCSLNSYLVAALRARVLRDAQADKRGPVAAVLDGKRRPRPSAR